MAKKLLLLLCAAAPAAGAPERWTKIGVYDAPMCETSLFYWKPTRSMVLFESICCGDVSCYWDHASATDARYLGHSYFRVRDLATGRVLANIPSSVGMAFGAAFVDYDHGRAWIFGTPHDRQRNQTRPEGPPPVPADCGWKSQPGTRCGGVWAWWSSDLLHWERAQTDMPWSGPNVDVARVYGVV